MSLTACPLCCHPCIRFCCPNLISENYPQAKYLSPKKANSTLQSHQSEPITFERAFTFHQPKTEYSIHPHVHTSDIGSYASVVSDQPRAVYSEHSYEKPRIPMPLASDTLPTLQFSLYYDIQKNTLTVHLMQAYNLPTKSHHNSCSTNVVLYLLPNKLEVFESQTVHKSANPAYEEIFQFLNLSGSDQLRKQSLVFRIFEHNRFSSKDVIGMVTLDLEDADLLGICTNAAIERVLIPTRKLNLRRKLVVAIFSIMNPEHRRACVVKRYISLIEKQTTGVCGSILCSIKYMPRQSTVQGVVLRVTDLHSSELTTTHDQYVKVSLYHKLIRQYQWKSSKKKQTISPTYNERFEFDVLDMNVDSLLLEILVMDYDRFGRDIVIGTVKIGANVSEDSCKVHWEEVIRSPNTAVSRWHCMSRTESARSKTHTL